MELHCPQLSEEHYSHDAARMSAFVLLFSLCPQPHFRGTSENVESIHALSFIDDDSDVTTNNNTHLHISDFYVPEPEAETNRFAENGGTPEAEADDTVTVVLENAKNEKSAKADDFRSLIPFCLMFGLGSLFSQSLTVYLASQITVIEKAFDLTSTQSGILLSANDVGFVATVLCASHFLKNYHIPRILSMCVFIFGVSGMLTSLPHFLKGDNRDAELSPLDNSSTYREDDLLLCLPQNAAYNKTMSCATRTSQETDSGSGQTWMMVLVVSLMVLQGIAKAPRSALSSLYIDNNSKREKTGFYLGVLTSFNIFGPFVAVICGGLFNKIPVDLKETSLGPGDPRWISAWWLGFVVFGAGAVLISVPMFFFPATLRKGDKQVSTDTANVEYANTSEIEDRTRSQIKEIQDLPKSVLRVLTNPVYISLNLATVTFIFAIMALGSFGPKYIENQFHIPTWKANIVLGINKLLTTVLGTLLGGIVTRRYRMDMLACMKLILITRLIGLVCDSFNFLWGCDNPHFIGLDSMNSTSSCDCESTPYLPVCANGSTYFSPCHAQCTEESGNMYTNCTSVLSGSVEKGMCDTGCNALIPFVALNCLGSMISTMAIAPTFLVSLRCVQIKDRAMGVGLNSFIMALFVFIPAPILYGKVFDSTCIRWQASCSGNGSCAVYDVTAMRFSLVSIEVGLKVVSVLLTVLCFWCTGRSKKIEEDGSSSVTKEIKPPIPQPRVSLSKQAGETVF